MPLFKTRKLTRHLNSNHSRFKKAKPKHSTLKLVKILTGKCVIFCNIAPSSYIGPTPKMGDLVTEKDTFF